MNSPLRIIDANANRAREALRVLEEAARFLLDDADLSAAAKNLRHGLAEALTPLPDLPLHRDTPGDIGTTISTQQEATRASSREVVIAAGKRLSEALRSIEEYAKTLGEAGAGVAAAVEQLRYRGYELERQLTLALPSGAGPQWRLCLLLTESLCRLPWRTVLEQALDAGADCIQVREKEMPGGDLLSRVREVIAMARPAGASVIVNDRLDVALASGADGVHLGQTDLPCAEARRTAGGDLLIGVSTSQLSEAKAARRAGASYCGVGPMFPTTTKHKPVIAGPEYLRDYLAWGGLPHLAIGGIGPAQMLPLRDAGVRGVAVSSAVCAAQSPGEVTRQILAQIPTT